MIDDPLTSLLLEVQAMHRGSKSLGAGRPAAYRFVVGVKTRMSPGRRARGAMEGSRQTRRAVTQRLSVPELIGGLPA